MLEATTLIHIMAEALTLVIHTQEIHILEILDITQHTQEALEELQTLEMLETLELLETLEPLALSLYLREIFLPTLLTQM
jgi:hypothetical protein